MESLGQSRWWRRHLVEIAALAATSLLAAIDSADALRAALAAVVDPRASNVGDPWPTVVAARSLLSPQGPHPSLYAAFSADGSSFIYPPIAAVLMRPFARLSYEEALVALSVVSRFAYVACVVLAGAIAARAPARRSTAIASALVLAVCFYPLLRAVQLNQATLLVTVCVGVSMLAARLGWPALAGILLGLTSVFKPQLVLVAALIVRQSPRLSVSALGTAGATAVLSLATAGLADHVDYATRVLPRLSAGYAFYPNQCWTGAVLRAAGEPLAGFALAQPSVNEHIAAVALSVLTLGSAAVVLWRAAHPMRGAPLVLAMGLGWVAVTLASPVSWEHHYAPAMFLFALLAARPDLLPASARLAAGASFPLIASYVEVRGVTSVFGRLASSTVVLGGVLLAAALAGGLLAPRSAPSR